jgi:CelD/BcsL family acetyltransferase involved in cellulose biosynthesis
VPYRVESVRDPERFAELAGEWDSLAGDAARPFDAHAWYAAWWHAFGGAARLEVGTAWSGERLTAAFPLLRHGRRLAAMANVHTPVYRPIAADPEALRAVVLHMLESRPSALELPALPADADETVELRREAEGAGLLTTSERQHVSPIVDTSGSFEDWRKGSKPRWRAPLERFRRKMVREHAASFSIVEPPSNLDAELRAGFEVEASGWKGKAGTAIVASPETETFYWEVAERFHERGELRLSRIVLDGKVAAFDMCLLSGNRLYLLKTGFDESFRKLAPGLVMRLSTIERCFELGLAAHELLGDDTEWKRKFATGERAHQRLDAYPYRPAGLVRYAYRSRLRPVLREVYARTAGRK